MSKALSSVGEARRLMSSVIDALLVLVCGLAAGVLAGTESVDGATVLHLTEPRFWGTAVGTLFGASFLNHVVLTVIGLASQKRFAMTTGQGTGLRGAEGVK